MKAKLKRLQRRATNCTSTQVTSRQGLSPEAPKRSQSSPRQEAAAAAHLVVERVAHGHARQQSWCQTGSTICTRPPVDSRGGGELPPTAAQLQELGSANTVGLDGVKLPKVQLPSCRRARRERRGGSPRSQTHSREQLSKTAHATPGDRCLRPR